MATVLADDQRRAGGEHGFLSPGNLQCWNLHRAGHAARLLSAAPVLGRTGFPSGVSLLVPLRRARTVLRGNGGLGRPSSDQPALPRAADRLGDQGQRARLFSGRLPRRLLLVARFWLL